MMEGRNGLLGWKVGSGIVLHYKLQKYESI